MLRGGANSNLKFLGCVLRHFTLLLDCFPIVSALDREAMQVKTVNKNRKLNYSTLLVKLLNFYLFVAFQWIQYFYGFKSVACCVVLIIQKMKPAHCLARTDSYNFVLFLWSWCRFNLKSASRLLVYLWFLQGLTLYFGFNDWYLFRCGFYLCDFVEISLLNLFRYLNRKGLLLRRSWFTGLISKH